MSHVPLALVMMPVPTHDADLCYGWFPSKPPPRLFLVANPPRLLSAYPRVPRYLSPIPYPKPPCLHRFAPAPFFSHRLLSALQLSASPLRPDPSPQSSGGILPYTPLPGRFLSTSAGKSSSGLSTAGLNPSTSSSRGPRGCCFGDWAFASILSICGAAGLTGSPSGASG